MRIATFIIVGLLALPAFAADKPTDKLEEITLWRGDSSILQAEELLKQRKFSDSLDVLERITRRNMRGSDAHVYTGIAWYNLGNMEKADASVKNALAIDQGHMGAYVMAGLISLKKEEKSQAEYYLQALRVVCGNDVCPEFLYLQKAIREYKEED
jgi:tetratricopeptide (TPR) repeat protein